MFLFFASFNEQPNVAALAVADRFLDGWRRRDVKAQLALVTPRVTKGMSQDAIMGEMCGLSNPHHWAYSVSDEKKIGAGRYAFSVMQDEEYTGYKQGRSSPVITQMVVVKTAAGWRVDETPGDGRGVSMPFKADVYDDLAVVDRVLREWQNVHPLETAFEVDGFPVGSDKYRFSAQLYERGSSKATHKWVVVGRSGKWSIVAR